MDRLISEQAVLDMLEDKNAETEGVGFYYEHYVDYIKALPPVNQQEPCEDAISRQTLLKLMGEEPFNWTDSDQELQAVEDYRNFRNMVEQLPPVKPQEPKTEQFAKWVASEIFDEWEYNKDTFAEIACRKLEKLGIVRAKGDEWELVEPRERSEE